MIRSLLAKSSQMTSSNIADLRANYGNETSKRQEMLLEGKNMKKGRETKTSQSIVSTPLWLQRRMLKNLQSAAFSRISPTRARQALEILTAIRIDSKPTREPVKDSRIEPAKSAPKVAHGWTLRITEFTSAFFLKVHFCIIRVKALFHTRINNAIAKSAVPGVVEPTINH